MPRAQTSKAGGIIGFFRTAPLETAELILGLCQDEVRERASKSNAAKVRAKAAQETAAQSGNGVAVSAAAPAGKAKAKAAGKKKSHKRKPAAPVAVEEPGLPGVDVAGESEPGYEGGEVMEYVEP